MIAFNELHLLFIKVSKKLKSFLFLKKRFSFVDFIPPWPVLFRLKVILKVVDRFTRVPKLNAEISCSFIVKG